VHFSVAMFPAIAEGRESSDYEGFTGRTPPPPPRALLARALVYGELSFPRP